MVKKLQSPFGLIIFAYLVVYIVWGSTFFFIEKALHAFPPFVIGSIRFLTAGTILMVYCKIKGYRLYEPRAVKQALFVGFLLLFLDMAAVIWSEQFISSGIVSIISAATVIWFIVLDKPRWKENFSSPTTVIGLIMGFLGVLMLFAEQIFNDSVDEHDQSMVLIAMIVMTMGTIAWTIGSLYSKYSRKPSDEIIEIDGQKTAKSKDLHVSVKTAWQMLTAGVVFTLVGTTNGDYAGFDAASVPLEYWGAIVYLIFMGSILAFSSYIWLLQVRPATEVSTHAYVNPIVALLLAHFFTDHIVTGLQILGLCVVLSSVLLMNWRMYSDTKLIHNLKRKRRIKKLRNMAPKSSIPRIVEIAEFAENEAKERR
ncbi:MULTISPECIES: EamA family transporter [Sphingobacterium]|uniref:EamA family transporter n=1 Tax=Sphingobacterium populi TaxID=1812824 RepID=A0ABW5U8J5_9SPHI|nr:EamA family transporter [Sphingobacterium sp. CFCC 11742]